MVKDHVDFDFACFVHKTPAAGIVHTCVTVCKAVYTFVRRFYNLLIICIDKCVVALVMDEGNPFAESTCDAVIVFNHHFTGRVDVAPGAAGRHKAKLLLPLNRRQPINKREGARKFNGNDFFTRLINVSPFGLASFFALNSRKSFRKVEGVGVFRFDHFLPCFIHKSPFAFSAHTGKAFRKHVHAIIQGIDDNLTVLIYKAPHTGDFNRREPIGKVERRIKAGFYFQFTITIDKSKTVAAAHGI